MSNRDSRIRRRRRSRLRTELLPDENDDHEIIYQRNVRRRISDNPNITPRRSPAGPIYPSNTPRGFRGIQRQHPDIGAYQIRRRALFAPQGYIPESDDESDIPTYVVNPITPDEFGSVSDYFVEETPYVSPLQPRVTYEEEYITPPTIQARLTYVEETPMDDPMEIDEVGGLDCELICHENFEDFD